MWHIPHDDYDFIIEDLKLYARELCAQRATATPTHRPSDTQSDHNHALTYNEPWVR